MKNIFFALLITCGFTAHAQQFSITGQLVDSLQNPLPSATVMLLDPGDSSLVNFVLSDAQGHFSFNSLSRTSYLLKATFMGYRSYEKVIDDLPDTRIIDLGRIKMEPASNELEAIEIAAERAPVTIKKDTIEFNANSFRTKENALVEDLLKKLPGVEIDHDGNITAQGEQVKNVTVDGKKFFGNDPKIATRNLPADAVDKVQVFDKQSDQATFTGIDDGQREKTINLELKEEKRNAMFGNVVAGAGTEQRVQARASLNKFTKGRQLSFLGMGNNVNQAGFGMEDYLNFTGNSRQMMGGGGVRIQMNSENTNGVPLNFGNRANGLMGTVAGGLNVNNEFNKNTEINASHFYNYLNHDLNQTTLRENFLQNGSYTFNENKRENNSNAKHMSNVTLDHKIDSANTLRFTASSLVNITHMEQSSASENINPDGALASSSERAYRSQGEKISLNTNLLYRHRFGKKGRSVSANFSLSVNKNESSGLLNAENTFDNGEGGQESLDQSNEQLTDHLNYGGTVSYTEPLGGRKYIEANYNFRQQRSEVTRNVFDIANEEAILNPSFSKRYDAVYQFQRAGLNFRIAKSEYNFVAGGSFQESSLRGALELRDSRTEKTFTNLLPSVRFHYSFSNSKHLRFDYETSVREPEIEQLQPVVDNSDPLNIFIGNPDLRPSYVQSWRLNFTSFNPANFITFFALTDIDYTSKAIVNAQYIDEHFARTITPVNVSSNLALNTNVHVGIPVKKLSGRFSIAGHVRAQKSIAILNDQANDIAQQTSGGTLRYTYQYKEILDLSVSTAINHQLTRYEFNQPDQTYTNRTHVVEMNLSFLKEYSFSGTFDYLIYKNRELSFDQRIPLLNLSLSRFFFRNKSGELKFSASNLLDQALGVDQTADINFLQRVTTNSLGRYFMISFTYALNKQLNPMAMRRSGAMMRIQR